MLLDLLRQGQAASAHGISAPRPFTSLQEELSFTEILTSCLSETSSPLLHAQQEGVPETNDTINNIHTHHSRFKSQNLPLNYRSTPLRNLNPQEYHNQLKCAPSAELGAHVTCTRSCNSGTETLAWASQQSSLHEAPNYSTSTATSEPSSTLENVMNACDFAPVQAWPQQSSDRTGDMQRIKDAAQHSCQTSLDEGSSMQESLPQKNMGQEDAYCHRTSWCRRTGTRANPVEESCSFHNCGAHNASEWAGADEYCTVASRPAARKRKRSRSCKNSEEVESQRMTHIAVERNRRKQMNENLSILRSLIPTTYIQRGDQASVIGGAIDFVKELEHVLQALQTQKNVRRFKGFESSFKQGGSSTFEEPKIKQEFSYPRKHGNDCSFTNILDDKFTHVTFEGIDVDVRLIGTSALVKVLAKKLPHQLLKVACSIESFHIRIMHLNITTIDKSVLYSFNLEVQGDSQFRSANGIAQLVQKVFTIENHFLPA